MTYDAAVTRPDVYQDRLAAVRAGGPDTLIRLMHRFPLVADAVAGTGPLSVQLAPHGLYWGKGQPITDLDALARLLAAGRSIELAIHASATRNEQQLLALAAWHGGSLTPSDLATEDIGAEELERAVRGLSELLMTDASRGWVVLRPGIIELAPLPGIPIRAWSNDVTSAQLGTMLTNLGVSAGPRKWERLEALEAALRDETMVRSAVVALDDDSRKLFLTVARSGGAGTRAVDAMRAAGMHYTTLHRLSATGLVGFSGWDGRMWVWLDVLVALAGGRMFEDWSEPAPDLRDLSDDEVVRVPPVVGRLEQLLDLWTTSPPPALKSGGLGVRSVRSAAKVLGRPSEEVGLLSALAADLGLITTVVTGRHGRGRNQAVDQEWRVTGARDAWRGQSPARRWARLLQCWLDSDHLETSGKAIERYERGVPQMTHSLVRTTFLHALRRIPEGSGAPSASMVGRLVFEHPGLFAPAIIRQLIEEARILGLVPNGDVVGLGSAGRTLLAGVADLESGIAGASDRFVIQADHTIIAPPDLHHDITTMLERFTRLESDAGARIYRVTAEDTVRALDAGWTTTEMLDFLSEYSEAPVASNVERTILDAGERHGRLQVGDATTWVACDDPALLASAVAVRAAKLEAISPTLAVSGLSRDKVVVALRVAGLAPGERVGAKPETPEVRSIDTRHPLRDRPVRTDGEVRQLATALFANSAVTMRTDHGD